MPKNLVAIVTANYGGVDSLYPILEKQTISCDYWAFGDMELGWNTPSRTICGNLPNIYQAKIPKILPEYALQGCTEHDYEWLIWMDASCHITDARFAEWMIASTEDHDDGWGVFRHSKRDNVGDEVTHSLSWDRYAGHPLERQYRYYLECGFSDSIGLFECTVFVRRSTLLTRTICADWMNQIMLWSFQDQISLPFVFWQHNFNPSKLPKTVYNAPYHEYHGHKSYEYTLSERLHANIPETDIPGGEPPQHPGSDYFTRA